MDTFIPALLLLSGGAFIHTRSNVPELRPASDAADTIWKLLAGWPSSCGSACWCGASTCGR
ncbi:hypothetical protein [Teichococcus aestuarii]|uniref:hypothetical protein n=1 Tax=Teichococcus aestuarii TaxID=568898 RepID=UPI0036215EA7